MIQYIVILLDDTSVSFCHYQNKKNRRRLMPLETLKSAIVYAMKENMSIQFVYPDYPLLPNYEEIIDSTDHIKIKPAKVADDADVVVFNSITEAKGFVDYSIDEVSYVIRTKRCDLFAEIDNIIPLLQNVFKDASNIVEKYRGFVCRRFYYSIKSSDRPYDAKQNEQLWSGRYKYNISPQWQILCVSCILCSERRG